MKKKFIAAVICSALMSLTACGGGIANGNTADITKKADANSASASTIIDEINSDTDSKKSDTPSDSDKSSDTQESKADSEAKKDTNTDTSDPESLLESMSLKEKVGQLFVVRPDVFESDDPTATANDSDSVGVTWLDDEMKATLKEYPVGGVIMFSMNITDPDQISKLTADFQSSTEVPMFIAVDEEGGQVARLANTSTFDLPTFESMQAVGATGDTNEAYNVGTAIGKYLNTYGFNVDFAPDCDVNTNPDNIVIGDRAFGSDPELVAQMVPAAIKGFHEQNIITCIKHFPGHGDTTGDTHEGYVSVTKTWDELKECELIPFKASFDTTDMVMAAHITVPNITDDGLPCSMSKEMITDKLRGELGYNGIVITDAMGMGAISQNYTSATGAVSAITAGVDIVLMPENLGEAFNAVIDAVNNGTISEDRLDESVLRILNLKDKYGLLK